MININGFKDPKHKLRNVVFQNMLLPDNGKVVINDAEKVKFTNVQSVNGAKPEYVVANSTGIVY